MKAKIYSVEELNNLTVEQLEKAIRTQAERYNRAISRAKHSGLNLSPVGGSKRVPLKLKGSFTSENDYINELISHYQNIEMRFAAGATKTARKEAYNKLYNRLAGIFDFNLDIESEKKNFDDFFEKYYKNADPAEQERILGEVSRFYKSAARHEDKAYYNFIGIMIERQKIKSYSKYDIAGTEADYATRGLSDTLKSMIELFEKEAAKK